MKYYEKNIETIKNNRPFMYKSMKENNVSSNSNQLDEIYSIDTKDGEKAVLIKIKENEYRLNSTYYPKKEADKWVEQFEYKHLNNIISMFGFGNGIFARALLKNMGESDHLLIYEPCLDLFLHVINNYDIIDILEDKRVSIAVENWNQFEFHNSLQATMNITNMSNQIMCVYPQYDTIFSESCVLFWKELKASYRNTKTNINTEIAFGKRFLDNILNNATYLKNSNSLMEMDTDMFKDATAIVVAAGPSVEEQIEELKKAKGKAVIFAVDRILDYLLKEGLEPDFIVTLDPIKPIAYFSKRTDIEIPLICFMEANYEILKIHKGKKIIANCSSFLNDVYIENKKVPPTTKSSASVATFAFTACTIMGFERIILVGQDLAYNGDKSHAGGVEEKIGSDKDVMVEGINGELIKSRFDWKTFITWYQDLLTIFPDLKVIDAKEKGAKIKGTTVMPLREAVEKYCTKEFSCNQSVAQMEPTFSSEEMLHIKKYFEHNLELLEKVKNKAKEAIKCCETLTEENNCNRSESKKSQEAFKKLGKINRYIEKQPIYKLMDHYVTVSAAQDIVGMYHFTNNMDEDRLKTFEKAKAVFEALAESAEFIRPKLEEAIKNIL